MTLSFALVAASAFASEPASIFEEKVRPLLAARCFGCHGDARVSGLRLDSRAGMLAGGRLGPAIVPGDPNASLLLQAVTHTHARLKMPPAERLPAAEIETLRQWIAAGASWPESKAAATTGKINASQRAFWSFVPLRKPPAATIDSLIAAKLRQAGIEPAPKADARTLARRAAYDLTGLPPPAEARFPALVDQLLASPHFGERWARHWLDVARYAEDDVLGLSQEKYPNAWRYRDWVVAALNRDLTYDVFIKAQIAGDLMPAISGFDLRPALGLFGLGPWHYAISPPPQARADERHDRIDTLTRGVLGLTVACARCHDHKFDPISTRDYYALAGVFASTEYREYPLAGAAQVAQHEQHQQQIRDKEKSVKDYLERRRRVLESALAAQTARFAAAARSGAAAGTLDAAILARWKAYFAKPEHDHPFATLPPPELEQLLLGIIGEKRRIDEEKQAAVERSKPPKNSAKTRLPNGFETYDEFCPGCDIAVRALDRDKYAFWNDMFRESAKDRPGGVYWIEDKDIQSPEIQALRSEIEALKKSAPKPYPFLHGIADKPAAVNLRIALRGDPYSLGAEVPRRFIEVLSPVEFHSGSGRLELAEAVMAQPIAARVAANRIWMHLMGRPLAGSPSNFGRFGERPSHPELLEYLAARLVEEKWSVKALVREILLSDTYQRSSATHAAADSKDAANRLFWRANRRRLDAETLRDQILAAAGSLDATIGGPSEDLGPAFRRRAIYGRVSRFKLNEALVLFDFPSPSITSEKRGVTHVPLQRLYFLNNGFVTGQAEALAARVKGDLSLAYRLLFQREPTADEAQLARDFLASADWTQFAQVLLASNEFQFID